MLRGLLIPEVMLSSRKGHMFWQDVVERLELNWSLKLQGELEAFKLKVQQYENDVE